MVEYLSKAGFPGHPRQGCIIDWECADFFQVDTRLTVKHAAGIRVSLDTATSRYVEDGTYGPSHDLVALVLCWKIATQLETHKATKNWSQLPATIEHFRTTINVYWMQNSRDCALTEMAKKKTILVLLSTLPTQNRSSLIHLPSNGNT